MSVEDKIFVVYVFVLLFSLSFSFSPAHTPCKPSGICKCSFPNNFGIDLKKLDSTNFTVNVENVKNKTEVLFQPCKNVNFHTQGCSSVSLCLVETVGFNKTTNETIKEYKDLGSIGDGKMIWERIADTPKLEYLKEGVRTEIIFNCDLSGAVPSLKLISHTNTSYALELLSSQVCPRVLSPSGPEGHHPASIIAIILLVLFLVYLVGGYLVLRFIRGAQGVEAVPNHEFWLSVPSKLKSGVMYVLNGCQPPTHYDRI